MRNHLPEPELDRHFAVGRWLRLNLALLILVGLFSSTFPFVSLDQKLGDFYFRLRGPEPTSTATALVLIDDSTLARYGRWPWHRRNLAQLVRVIASLHPKALGIDILLSEPEDDLDDTDLAQAIASAENVVLASKISTSPAHRLWVDPLPLFSKHAVVGQVQATIDADGICRRIPILEPSIEGARFAFALKLAEMANPRLTRLEAESRQDPRPEQAIEGEHILPRSLRVNYRQQFMPGQAIPPFVTVSAGDLLQGRNGRQLRDKAVLLGFGATELSDRLFTPVSNQLPMPGVEINANIVDTLLQGKELQDLGGMTQMFLLGGWSMLLLWIVVRWPGTRGLLALAGALLAAFAAGYALFVRSHLLFHYGPFLLAGVIAAPLAQLENLVVVERAISRRLRELQRLLNLSSPNLAAARKRPSDGTPRPPLHWKLKALSQFQDELISLYTFDEMLIETMEEPLAVFGVDGQLIFHNASWRSFCKKQEIKEAPCLKEVLDFVDGWQDLATLTQKHNGWLATECSFKRGQWRIRAARLPRISESDPGAIMLLLEDVTARHERDLARAEALSFVTHELRTPLVAIQGFAEFLTRYPDKSATSEAPATIFRESRRLVAMINAYLEVLRLDAGSRPLNLRPVDVSDVVKHVVNVLQPVAQAARIRLKIENQAETPLVECDEPLISGALLNLLSNAIKYSPADSEVILRTLSRQNTIEFAVHNPGPAIPADEQERLFEPFYRSPRQEGTKPGWGLGLAFVKRIAEQHEGQVEVTSDTVSGTCFRLILPVAFWVGSEVQL